jgi:O-antigen/teichoic acid export membrane protein
VTIFGVIVDFGIQQYIIKKISEQPSRAKVYFQNFLAIEIVLAAIVYIALLVVAKSNNYEPLVFHAIAVAGIGMATHALTYPFLAVMSAFHDLRKVALINFFNSLINFIIIVSAITFHRSIVFLVSNQLIFGLLAITLYSRFVRKRIPSLDVLKGFASIDGQLVKKILLAAVPFALLVGFSTIYNRIDMVLISKFLGYEQTGLYAAAYKFFDFIGFFPSVVSFSLYPVFAGYVAAKNFVQLRETVEKYLRFMTAIAFPMAIAGMILSRHIITLLAGDEFLPAAKVLAVLVWAPAALFIYVVANALVISQLTKKAVLVTGLNVAINVVGNILLLPRIGIMGAAIMTVVSELLQGIFYIIVVRKKIVQFRFWVFIWQPLLASLVMGIVLWYIRDFGLYLTIPVGGIIYLLSLFSLQFYEPGDIDFVKKLISKAT